MPVAAGQTPIGVVVLAALLDALCVTGKVMITWIRTEATARWMEGS